MKLSKNNDKKLVLNKRLIAYLCNDDMGKLYAGMCSGIRCGSIDIKTENGTGCVPEEV